MTFEKKKQRYLALRKKKILQARRCFWTFQKINSPDDFKDERTWLIVLALSLQSFYKDEPASYLANHSIEHHQKLDLSDSTIDITFEAIEDKTLITVDNSNADILIVEAPRRHHKSHSLINFEDWVFGQDPKHIMITSAHNTDLANEFSQYVRDGIEQVRMKSTAIIYSDIFPFTRMKYGDRSKKRWALEGNFLSYTGSGILTPVTGKGGKMIVFDDPIKGPLEAFNEQHLDKVWSSYTNGWLAPLEKPRKQILVMTPWITGDPGDRIIKGAAESGEVVKIYNCKVYSDTQGMLCEDILDKRAFDILSARLDPIILSGNYLCKRLGLAGKLYTNFNLYKIDDQPKLFSEIYAYIDTADEGMDFLDAGIAGIHNTKDEFGLSVKKAYMLDVYHTQDGMEITEEETARFLIRNHIQKSMTVVVESNNGGRGFARNVERILREKYPNESKGIYFEWFHQSENKKARINSQSNTIMKHFLFPADWRTRDKSWTGYSESMINYSKEGENAHDDCADMTTGIAEHINTDLTMMEALRQRRAK